KALADQSGFGEKKIRLIEEGIQKSLKQPFRKVLVALGIPELGKKGADILVNAGLDSMEKLLEVAGTQDVQRLVSIRQIGEKSAQLYIDALNDPAMLRRIEALASLGLSMVEQQQKETDLAQIFAGQVWCVTGSFEHFNPRGLALGEVEKRGGRTVSSVTGKTTHLLAGSGAGSKLEAARKLGVAIVDEQMFLSLLESGVPKREEMQGEFSF
ncbi:MAG: DNA ligase (NAD(+)) LigA, partial [Sphaerochaeta sp.]|nr:DNA ligase (NAD(+)) LigA [Sphaerochaeta sp.]